MYNSRLARLITTIFFIVAPYFAQSWVISPIVGSQYASFSMASCLFPLSGYFCSLWVSIGSLVLSNCLTGKPLFVYLAYHLPGFCAALYWKLYQYHRGYHQWYAFGLVVTCFTLFALHPIGNEALGYTLYWLIPLYFSRKKGGALFAHALSSTFIAHAVGSTIWLYTHNLTAKTWLTLIPIVFWERLAIASAMILCIYLISYGRRGVSLLSMRRAHKAKTVNQ